MLTTQLRELQAHGLVLRRVYAEVPVRVEYELAALALSLKPVFAELTRWCEAHVRDGPGANADRRSNSRYRAKYRHLNEEEIVAERGVTGSGFLRRWNVQILERPV
jgi:hypothetical protein